MFQATSSTPDESIRLIDLQVVNLQESIRVLYSQRNGHVPISRLPVEILTEIFLLHQSNSMQTYEAEMISIPTLDWIGITHVSQRWRKIALDFSSLWIRIPFRHPKWAKEMIARSQYACPIVKANYLPSRFPFDARLLKTFLQKNLSRVQVLDLDSGPQLIGKLFQDIQATSVPSLSTLSLSLRSMESETPSSAVLDSLQIVDSRLLDTHSLRTLNIVSAPTVGWGLKLFSGLTHLKVDDSRAKIAATQTTQRDFLDALHRMPTLQSLHLDGSLPEAVNRSSLKPVHLQDLRDLNVLDTVPLIEFFLHHVTFPPTTRTSIGCTHLHPVLKLANISSVLVPLKRLLSRRRRASKICHIDFLCMLDDTWDLAFKGWGHSSFKGYFSDADFTFFVRWKSDEDHDMDVISQIDELGIGVFSTFPQDDVVSLQLEAYCDICFRPFAHKIGQLPALTALYLSFMQPAPFVLELDCDVPQEGDDPSLSAPTFPALRYLTFDHCPIDDSIPMTLYHCLKKRCDLGLRKLTVTLDKNVEVDKKHIALLKEVVNLSWGRNSENSDSD